MRADERRDTRRDHPMRRPGMRAAWDAHQGVPLALSEVAWLHDPDGYYDMTETISRYEARRDRMLPGVR